MTAETIPQSMEAVRLHGVEDFRVEQIPTPRPGFREVLCRVEAVTICGTDIAIIQGRHQQWTKHLPMTLGHEWAGRVVALGEGAAGFGNWATASTATSQTGPTPSSWSIP